MKRLIFIFVLSLMCVEIAFANDLFISVSGSNYSAPPMGMSNRLTVVLQQELH